MSENEPPGAINRQVGSQPLKGIRQDDADRIVDKIFVSNPDFVELVVEAGREQCLPDAVQSIYQTACVEFDYSQTEFNTLPIYLAIGKKAYSIIEEHAAYVFEYRAVRPGSSIEHRRIGESLDVPREISAEYLDAMRDIAPEFAETETPEQQRNQARVLACADQVDKIIRERHPEFDHLDAQMVTNYFLQRLRRGKETPTRPAGHTQRDA